MIKQLINIDLNVKLYFIFYAGGHFNYGRDPGWKIPSNPMKSNAIRLTIGKAHHIISLINMNFIA